MSGILDNKMLSRDEKRVQAVVYSSRMQTNSGEKTNEGERSGMSEMRSISRT